MGLEVIGLLNVLLALGFILHGFSFINVRGKDKTDRWLFGAVILLLSAGFFVSGISIMAGALNTTQYVTGILALVTIAIKIGKILVIWTGVARLYKKYKRER